MKVKVGQIIIDKDGKKYKITQVTNFNYSSGENSGKRWGVILKEVKD